MSVNISEHGQMADAEDLDQTLPAPEIGKEISITVLTK